MNGIEKITGQIDADVQKEIDELTAQAQAQAALCEYAQRSVLGDMIAGKILGQEPAFREASGLFWMDMTCACQEMIARQRPAELFEGEDTND